MSDQSAAPMRSGRELHDATMPFAVESTTRSWMHVGSTFVLVIASLTAAAVMPWWWLRALFSVLSALIMVRTFILYHDFMHGSILRESRLAKALFYVYGALNLTPPRSWNFSHNFHHANVGKIEGSHIGSFPIMTTEMWKNASWGERFSYRVSRSPITLLFAYFTVFALSITAMPIFKNGLKSFDSALSLIAHFGVLSTLWVFGGFDVAFFAMLLPMTISGIFGGFLFFSQHSFEEAHVLEGDKWNYFTAAVESSSYLRTGRIMEWFTGNIGYHHVHHLNLRIPFYRLPEAMAAIPELQSPPTVTLHPRDIVACFRASLWDPRQGRMVSFAEARRAARIAA